MDTQGAAHSAHEIHVGIPHRNVGLKRDRRPEGFIPVARRKWLRAEKNDSRPSRPPARAELPSTIMLISCSNFLERALSSSPRDAGVGRGPRSGASSHNAPPLPGPLLHPMEERELVWLHLRAGLSGALRLYRSVSLLKNATCKSLPNETTREPIGSRMQLKLEMHAGFRQMSPRQKAGSFGRCRKSVHR